MDSSFWLGFASAWGLIVVLSAICIVITVRKAEDDPNDR